MVWDGRDHDEMTQTFAELSLGGPTSPPTTVQRRVLRQKTREQGLPICTTWIWAVGRTARSGTAIGLSIGVKPRRRVLELQPPM